MFWLKKLATLLLMPLFAGLTLVWTGLILSRTRRLKRYAGLLVAAGALPLTILSFQPVANEFIKPLEMCYPRLVNFQGIREAKLVVVLGGGHASNPDRPANLQKDDPFVLVTSAIHMPRAMLLFRQQGMDPVPAPAEITDFARNDISPFSFFPRAAALSKVEAAWHEYLGLLWAQLNG